MLYVGLVCVFFAPHSEPRKSLEKGEYPNLPRKSPFRGIPRNSRGIPRNSGNGWPIFQTLAIFSSFCSKNRVSSFFWPFWLVSTPNFPNPPPNDKKRLKPPTGANQKNDAFWPVECRKTQTNMRTNTEASLASHGTGRMVWPSCHDKPREWNH